MPIKHENPLDALMQLGIRRKYFAAATAAQFDNINDWIESLIETVQKKNEQYDQVKEAQDALLNDFQIATGLSYEDWTEKRAKELLEASK